MDLKEAFSKYNIDFFGVCDASLYNAVCGTDYRVCITALFPYFSGYPKDSNISIYTHGEDYHAVVGRILTSVSDMSGLTDYAVHSDIGPEIDRELALLSGLCFKGRNGLCINEKYGSYFFIGYIACNANLPLSEPLCKDCAGCRRCIEACPGGALKSGFEKQRCVSFITQKRGTLENWESELIKKSGYVFGCDICQRVCPHNINVSHTPLNEFKENLITSLSAEELDRMSNKEFQNKHSSRAFAWRGKKVLQRNLKIISQ